MQSYTVCLFLETALNVSGGTPTHQQEHTHTHTTVSTTSGNCQTLIAAGSRALMSKVSSSVN